MVLALVVVGETRAALANVYGEREALLRDVGPEELAQVRDHPVCRHNMGS